MQKSKNLIGLFTLLILPFIHLAQAIPSVEEKIPYISTFSKGADKNWGDDDFIQIFFFVIPESYKKPVYIRIYDPECGGNVDENHGPFNSKTKFSVYGGKKRIQIPPLKVPIPTEIIKAEHS